RDIADMALTVLERQVELIRAMTPERRVQLGGALYRAAWKLKASWLRSRFPTVSEAEIEEWVRRIFRDAGPWAPSSNPGADGTAIPYMVTGGFAAIVYGEPRLTNDVDVVIALNPEQMKLRYYRESGSDRHLRDIAAMRQISGDLIDTETLENWIERLGLSNTWRDVQGGS